MKILTRYILKEVIIFSSICLFAFVGILLTFRMLQLTSLIINKGVEFSQVAQIFLAIIPPFLEIALPLAALLGVMLALARMAGDSELVIIKSSGVSLASLLLPVAVFGLLATGLGLVISSTARPWGFQKLSKGLFAVARSRSTAGLDQGVFNKLGPITIYADEIDHHQGLLRHALIDDRRDPTKSMVIVSQRGLISSDEGSRYISIKLQDGYIHEFADGKYVITKFDTNNINLEPDELYTSDRKGNGPALQELMPHELSETISTLQYDVENFSQLSQAQAGASDTERPISYAGGPPQIMTLREAQHQLARAMVERERRTALPVAALVLALLAMPLGVQAPRAQRTWGIGIAAILGLGAFVLYYGIFSIGVAFGEGGKMAPWLAMWAPNIITIFVAGFLAHRICTERWQSIADGLGDLSRFFRRSPS